MPKIAFILLCHKDPDSIIQQAERLTETGDYISIHFDARAKAEHFQRIKDALSDNPNVAYAKKRIKCGWGEWSLVQATLHAVEAAVDAFPRASHFYMLSGDCMAIKTAEYAHDFLDAHDRDYIESFDYFASDWIKTGMKEERLIYRHFFNERTSKTMFYGSFNLQKKLGLTRKVPQDLRMMIGSQWWCLRRNTIEEILRFVRQNPDVIRFFRTTWIPDETFFQTLVRHLIPTEEIEGRTLTFLMFSDYGMPVTFYNDHYDLLLSQGFLFARKISSDAHELKDRLGELWATGDQEFKISNEGRNLFRFLAQRGRIGRRFAPRSWETESSLGRDRTLYIVTCKKWHVAKRFAAAVRAHTDLPAIDYLFDEENTPLPDLGGIEGSLDKRTRHRRALTRIILDYYQSDRMMICLDPKNLDLIRDFYTDRSNTRLLELECSFSEDYLAGHAKRVGLAGDMTSDETITRLLPTIRRDVLQESDEIRDALLADFFRMREAGTEEENTVAVADFLHIPVDAARNIVRAPHLFAD
ncbi:DUF5928 domain-containing protein [Halocynthiibacter namhaensis]|uniref:DUF5928 domain-containing protein n=1 Tax=Halocynthiibacter namhaensis TaxID=1290553 RepID=UPI000579022B|nr:DUF5928 domain-containing protein [Halocynthiibacter namhaensis]